MVRGAGFSATAPSGGRGRRCGGGWWLWLGSGVAPPVAQGGDAEGYAAHLQSLRTFSQVLYLLVAIFVRS